MANAVAAYPAGEHGTPRGAVVGQAPRTGGVAAAAPFLGSDAQAQRAPCKAPVRAAPSAFSQRGHTHRTPRSDRATQPPAPSSPCWARRTRPPQGNRTLTCVAVQPCCLFGDVYRCPLILASMLRPCVLTMTLQSRTSIWNRRTRSAWAFTRTQRPPWGDTSDSKPPAVVVQDTSTVCEQGPSFAQKIRISRSW